MTAMPGPGASGGREIRLAWERFNSDALGPSPDIREPVLASWRRSRQCGVSPDTLAVPHDVETDTESRFRWAAEPVLEDLAESGELQRRIFPDIEWMYCRFPSLEQR